MVDNSSWLRLDAVRVSPHVTDDSIGEAGVADTSERKLRIMMLGPALEVMGGVSSVERLILHRMPPSVAATHIPTVVDGGKLDKAVTFARACWLLNRYVEQRPDLVHVHFASRASSVRKEFFARLALRRGIPVIMHAHGAEYQMYWLEMNARQRSRTLQVLRRVHALIVLGDAWRDFFVSIGVPAEKIVVMRNPVQLPPQVPLRAVGDVLRFAYLGIVSRRKGAFDLIEAVASLRPQMRERLRLVMAGNGRVDEARDLVKRRGLADCVEVRGWLEPTQRDDLLARSHAFVLPSHNEGLPMALLEAMAWGLAPVCTPVGSIAEVVHDRVNGLLVRPGDIRGIAAAIEHLLEHPQECERLQRAARQSVEPLGLDTYIERLVSLYRTVAADRC